MDIEKMFKVLEVERLKWYSLFLKASRQCAYGKNNTEVTYHVCLREMESAYDKYDAIVDVERNLRIEQLNEGV